MLVLGAGIQWIEPKAVGNSRVEKVEGEGKIENKARRSKNK